MKLKTKKQLLENQLLFLLLGILAFIALCVATAILTTNLGLIPPIGFFTILYFSTAYVYVEVANGRLTFDKEED